MTRSAKSVVGAVRQDCPRCGAPVWRQVTGLPITVVADIEPLTTAEALARKGDNRLPWCLRESRWSTPRLIEAYSDHRQDCPHAHVVCHECPPGTPTRRRPEGALW